MAHLKIAQLNGRFHCLQIVGHLVMGLKNLNFEPGLLKFLSLYLTSYIEHKKESFVVGGVGLSGYGDLETRL